jgi:putative hydrolase of the HAD superfamily
VSSSQGSSVGPRQQIVIFDLGEVLVTPAGLIDALAARVACDPETFKTAYWTRRLEYDLGLRATEYWTDVLEGLGTVATPAAIEELVDIDSVAWTTVRPDAARLLEQVSSAGLRIGILSNATIDMARAARRAEWSRWVDDWFLSAEIGIAKPDPAIYRHVTETVGLPADRIAYIDDSAASIVAAQAAGWSAHLWTSGAETAAHLAELVDAVWQD